jgi:hypothetical protein
MKDGWSAAIPVTRRANGLAALSRGFGRRWVSQVLNASGIFTYNLEKHIFAG